LADAEAPNASRRRRADRTALAKEAGGFRVTLKACVPPEA
jgi:hypothetical protein